MSDIMPSSVSSSRDDFLDDIEDEAINDPELDAEGTSDIPSIDSRRRLEARLADRHLAKDIQEFDFDF
ncbi:MAG: PA3496 family putative envelope integrity protein [Cellvibrionaceae bacterium]